MSRFYVLDNFILELDIVLVRIDDAELFLLRLPPPPFSSAGPPWSGAEEEVAI